MIMLSEQDVLELLEGGGKVSSPSDSSDDLRDTVEYVLIRQPSTGRPVRINVYLKKAVRKGKGLKSATE